MNLLPRASRSLPCPPPRHCPTSHQPAVFCCPATCVCRCVLSDSGQAVALTRDHKAKDPNEARRVEQVGDMPEQPLGAVPQAPDSSAATALHNGLSLQCIVNLLGTWVCLEARNRHGFVASQRCATAAKVCGQVACEVPGRNCVLTVHFPPHVVCSAGRHDHCCEPCVH